MLINVIFKPHTNEITPFFQNNILSVAQNSFLIVVQWDSNYTVAQHDNLTCWATVFYSGVAQQAFGAVAPMLAQTPFKKIHKNQRIKELKNQRMKDSEIKESKNQRIRESKST